MVGPQGGSPLNSQGLRSALEPAPPSQPKWPRPSPSCQAPIGAELIGRGLEGVRSLLRELILTPLNFLLVGPTGVGKDLFARAFHRASTRRRNPLQVVDCTTIPESLFESHLFGCRKGAYTGADRDIEGILEAANGGIVVLNEITDVPLSVQAKLRQSVEEKLIWRVGESRPRRIDIWIAAATNRTDLTTLCDEGRFRRDLYFRLARMEVRIPALRHRAADIPELVEHLTQKAALDMRRRPIGFTGAAMRVLMGHSWPGNVRELENLIHSLTLTSEGSTIGVDTLPESVQQKPAGSRSLTISRDKLRRALVEAGWNVTRAANRIGVSREYVHALTRRYSLVRPAKKYPESAAPEYPVQQV